MKLSDKLKVINMNVGDEMALNTKKNIDGTTVLKVLSNLDDFDGAMKFRDDLDELCLSGEKRIVLDLSGISRMNGHGIGKILLFHMRLLKDGGELLLGPMSDTVRSTLEGLKLTEMINEYK